MTPPRNPWITANAIALAFAFPTLALAAGQGTAMPWNPILNLLAQNLTGPTAYALVIIAAFVALIAWALLDETRHLYRAGKVVIVGGIFVALAGGTLLSTFNISGAVV